MSLLDKFFICDYVLIYKVSLCFTFCYSFYLLEVRVLIAIGTLTFGRTLRVLSIDYNTMLELLTCGKSDEGADDIIASDYLYFLPNTSVTDFTSGGGSVSLIGFVF